MIDMVSLSASLRKEFESKTVDWKKCEVYFNQLKSAVTQYSLPLLDERPDVIKLTAARTYRFYF